MQVTHSGRVDLSLCREGVSERGGSILWDVYAISRVSIMEGSPCGRMGTTMGYGTNTKSAAAKCTRQE